MTDKERIATLLTALEEVLELANDLDKWLWAHEVGLGCADTALTKKQLRVNLGTFQEYAAHERSRLHEEREG